jgi:AraC family transcriptional regulator, transcriptional activator of pobA
MNIEVRKNDMLKYHGEISPILIRNAEEINFNVARRPHRHSYYTILWTFNQAGYHIVDTYKSPFLPQTIWFIAPGEVHCMKPPFPKGIMIQFIPELFASKASKDGFLSQLNLFKSHGLPLSVSKKQVASLMKHIRLITEAFYGTDLFRMEFIEAHLKLFLLECNHLSHTQTDKLSGNKKEQHPIVVTFKDMVSKHFSEWHKVEKYADAMCLSPHYLSDLFNQMTNLSPKEYISSQLANEAKRMAMFSNLSVKEIGYSLGFEDPSHFSRFFKQQTGLSFNIFRESISK